MVRLGRSPMLLAITLGVILQGVGYTTASELFPLIADVSHASLEAARFFHNFYTLKSSDSPDIVDCYNVDQTEYYDSTLGLTAAANRSSLVTELQGLEAQWAVTAPNDRSYPLRILGDTIHGAIVHAVDTPGLFGAEIRELSTFDFVNGTISRQIDAWDGRGNNVIDSLPGDPVYPDLGLPGLAERAAPAMRTAVDQLSTALSAGNATAAAELFSYDAVFEDMTLRLRVEGRIAITSYLNRTVHSLPYGLDAAVTHALGSVVGGGYEWRPGRTAVHYGVTALELDRNGQITRFTAVWDGSKLNQTTISELAQQAPEPS